MGIYGGLMGPKSENVEKVLVLPLLVEGSRGAGRNQANERPSEKWRLGWGRGRVNPPPCWLVWDFGRFGGFWNWFKASTRLEAPGLGGFYLRPLENPAIIHRTSVEHLSNIVAAKAILHLTKIYRESIQYLWSVNRKPIEHLQNYRTLPNTKPTYVKLTIIDTYR